MYRAPSRARSRALDYPLSILAVGDRVEKNERQFCPHQGCGLKLRHAPVGQEAQGLVCDHHGVVWMSRKG